MAKRASKEEPVRARLGAVSHSADFSQYTNVNILWKPIYCANYDEVEGKRAYHHLVGKKCECKPGVHWRTIQYAATGAIDELALVGGRGSGKSEDSFLLMILGDAASNYVPYHLNPSYRGLVLRENAKDLDDWVRRAERFYAPLGARLVLSPSIKIIFESGAELICDHLNDESAYRKYWGQEFARVLIEECPQISKESTYVNVRMSCRVKDGLGLRAMMIVIGNPDGPGLAWFSKRFIKLLKPVRSKETGKLRYRRLNPEEIWVNPLSGETRMYVHSTIYDNPYFLVGNQKYLQQLEGIPDENDRRRLLHGDFDAMVGQYFSSFRPNGPMPGEPANASHVVSRDYTLIEPWWPRLMGMDIGFQHHTAVIKAALNPNGQIIVYDEMVESDVDNEEWGRRIARWCEKELRELPEHSMPLFLSHDAFGQRGDRFTQAQQIEQGIRGVLGSAGAQLFRMSDDDEEDSEFFRKLSSVAESRILIRRPFLRQRVPGWDLIKILMRFSHPEGPSPDQMDRETADRIAREKGGEALLEYLSQFERKNLEVLPKLLITDNCKLLVETIPLLVYNTNGQNPRDVRKTSTMEDDVADAWRYLCTGYSRYVERMPRGVFLQRKMAQAMNNGIPDDRVYMHMEAMMSEYDQQEEENMPFRYGLGSSRLTGVRRVN